MYIVYSHVPIYVHKHVHVCVYSCGVEKANQHNNNVDRVYTVGLHALYTYLNGYMSVHTFVWLQIGACVVVAIRCMPGDSSYTAIR